nr:NfeD family protein [Pullulanibacillus pueri]
MFGEFLVRAKGIFGVISLLLFVLYFIHHLPNDSPVLMISLLVAGFILIVLDGKLINNGSVAILGLLLMMLACALPAPSWVYGLGVSAAFILGVCGSFLFLKVFPARAFWSKLTLMDQLSSEKGYNSINAEYKLLVGKIGKSITPFRPVGTIEVEGKQYSAITNGVWLERDQMIKVVSVDGTRIVIEAHQE